MSGAPAATVVLASFPSPPQGVWHLGPFPIRAYALWILLGIVVACWWGERRWAARGGQPGLVLDVALWAVPFGLVGGRLYHVCTDWQKYFGAGRNPMDAFRIWDGGLGIWGAVALGAFGAWLGLRRHGVRAVGAFGDAIAPGIVLAQGIGRLGNYFNQELYGRPTTLPWGLEIHRRVDEQGVTGLTAGHSTGEVLTVVHPTFLYELLWDVAVCVVLVLVDRRMRIGHGRLFALYVALYCVGRFGVELLRDDAATHVLGLRINTITAAVVCLAALVYVLRARRGREDPAELQPVDAYPPGGGAVTEGGDGTDGGGGTDGGDGTGSHAFARR